MAKSVFADFRPHVYQHQWLAVIQVESLVGGIPTDPKKAEGWLRSKLGDAKDDLIREKVAETMVERGVDKDTATEMVVALEHLNGFKRLTSPVDTPVAKVVAPAGTLYVEGRQMKACVKESSNIQWPQRRWGDTSKGTKGFFSEHVFVLEGDMPIFLDEDMKKPALEPTGIHQRFVHTWRGSGIQYEEYVEGAVVAFTVVSDYPFEYNDLATLWVSAEMQGFGASRSQGFGRFSVIRWEPLKTVTKSQATTGKKKVVAAKGKGAAAEHSDNGHGELVDA